MRKRFIFDLDGTLLTCDYSLDEAEFFRSIYGDDSKIILENIGKLLNCYENSHLFYDKFLLSSFLSSETFLDVTPQVIEQWIDIISISSDTLEEGVVDTLEYLKSKDISLVVLTNWFGKSQRKRLDTANILQYFDEVISGDMVLKPHSEAYMKAVGKYSPSDCIMIGDGLGNDYLGPRKLGIDSILYDKSNRHYSNHVKIKRIDEIINRY